jgi:DNA-binding NtrC family response regulator
VNRGSFREDLFFRLAVVTVKLPPLRARRDDIPLLVRHFVECFAPDRAERAGELVAALESKSFAGNVRELRNAVQRALALGASGGPTGASRAPGAATNVEPLLDLPYKDGLAQLTQAFELRYLEHALRECGGSVSAVARRAGLSRRYVQTLMVRHGLRKGDDGPP